MSIEKRDPSDVDVKDRDKDSTSQLDDGQFDFASYYDHNAGRLVVDPE